jgi:hypothetical protein
MSQYLCAKTYKVRPVTLRLSLFGIFVLSAVALFANTGCEDKAIGRSCDILTDAGAAQAVFNTEALECPSRVCLKPVVDPLANMPSPVTTPFCSASCSQDSDCDPNLLRSGDQSKSVNHRCVNGFACGIAFVKGKLCCQKLCLCKDFLNTSTGTQTPIACTGDGPSTCNNPSQ